MTERKSTIRSTGLQIVIPKTFSSLNQYIDALGKRKGRWNAGAAMKAKDQKTIRQYLPNVRLHKPVRIDYTFYERDRRRDHDNVSGYFHKIFQDALVEKGILPDDGWNWITGFSDSFYVDKAAPRIQINITEDV